MAGEERNVSEEGEEEGGLAPTRGSVDADEGTGRDGEGDVCMEGGREGGREKGRMCKLASLGVNVKHLGWLEGGRKGRKEGGEREGMGAYLLKYLVRWVMSMSHPPSPPPLRPRPRPIEKRHFQWPPLREGGRVGGRKGA